MPRKPPHFEARHFHGTPYQEQINQAAVPVAEEDRVVHHLMGILGRALGMPVIPPWDHFARKDLRETAVLLLETWPKIAPVALEAAVIAAVSAERKSGRVQSPRLAFWAITQYLDDWVRATAEDQSESPLTSRYQAMNARPSRPLRAIEAEADL